MYRPIVLLGLRGDTLCVGVARVGTETQAVCHAPLSEMATMDIGGPLQSLVIAGKLHPLEEKMLNVTSLSRTQDTCKNSFEEN